LSLFSRDTIAMSTAIALTHLSYATPLLARVYPNGVADVNQFQAAGGPGFVIREWIDCGAMHADVSTVAADGLRAYGKVPEPCDDGLRWTDLPAAPIDDAIVRTAAAPFSDEGGLKLLTGNLGRAVMAGRSARCATAICCGSTPWRTLDALVDVAIWAAREPVRLTDAQAQVNNHGLGRELFAGMRRNVLSAEQGACTWL
jgi:dihydroxyacid dehydratase/phosphogluconate dehydratase